jgi:VIT1/CCC1 family predicted Fe2+/Mn2+ transporter
MAKLFRKRPIKVPFGHEVFNSILGGSEGGLATTAAIIAGLFVNTESRELVVTTAFITFLVQAFNSSASRFSGERTIDEIEQIDEIVGYRTPLLDSMAQLLSHVIAGFIVLLPIVLITNEAYALATSILVALAMMFFMGFYRGRVTRNHALRDGLEMMVIGAAVISVGITAGWLL